MVMLPRERGQTTMGSQNRAPCPSLRWWSEIDNPLSMISVSRVTPPPLPFTDVKGRREEETGSTENHKGDNLDSRRERQGRDSELISLK